MSGLARTLRLMAGLGMIAAGSSLAAPACLQVAEWWQASTAQGSRAVGEPGGSPPAPDWSMPATTDCTGWTADPTPPAAVPRVDYVPPPPPGPLPPVEAGLVAPSPPLASNYRTTLAAPPPPLLDGQRPPPLAVGWAARGSGPAVTVRQPPAVPSTGRYRVRDGDDLTSIALRFYGTSAVARAIWEANRERLPDPGLLPIGLELRLPPPTDLDHLAGNPAADRRRSIDPVSTRTPVPQPPDGLAPGSWLQPDSRGGIP